MLKRIIYLIILSLIFSCNRNNNSPNIVFILTDDLGYGDLSSYGSETIETTNIDKLARDGVRLTSYYAAQPVCSASRGAILTGSYPNRIGIHNAFGPNSNSGINHDEYTLAEMLKENGYTTGIFGKWHLGSKKEFFQQNMVLMNFTVFFIQMICGGGILKAHKVIQRIYFYIEMKIQFKK
jgi:arylsulfatase